MPSPLEYRMMARDCLKEAETTQDADRRQTRRVAQKYMQTAHLLESCETQDNDNNKPLKK
jgi:hypothetical protein